MQVYGVLALTLSFPRICCKIGGTAFGLVVLVWNDGDTAINEAVTEPVGDDPTEEIKI